MLSFRISNVDVLIKNKEKNTPTEKASNTCIHSTLKGSNTNIKAPVLIKKGGKIIFLTDAGLLEALIRMNIIVVAIKAAPTVLAIAQNMKSTLFECLNLMY